MSQSLIFPLSEADNVMLAGGKAAALADLWKTGLPIPDGIVISVSAYKEHKEKAFETLSPSASNEQRAQAILSMPIDEELQRNISVLLKTKALWPVAVRSSCTVEDSEVASYAGQFETFLGVSNEDAALEAIRKCWASLWSAHARTYASNQNVPSDANMAVVLQRMIEPQFAGVAFSVDPTAAYPGVHYGEWVAGRGDSLVSGEGIAGRIWLNRDGVALRHDYLSNTSSPPPKLWQEITKLLARVVKTRGFEQDIEWAWKDGEAFLLQSRPITNSAPWNQVNPAPWQLTGRPRNGWTDSQRMFFDCWDEYNPPTVKPLEMDLFMGAVWQSSLDMFNSGGGVPEIEEVTVLVDCVPVQIDPAGGRECDGNKWPRGESRPDLMAAMDWGLTMVRQFRQQLGILQSQSSENLHKALNECASVHRTLGVTRLRSMQTWIDGESAAKSVPEPLLSKAGANVDSALEQLLAGVDHETRRMNCDLLCLVERFKNQKQTEFNEEFNNFIARYGHFQSEGISLSETRETLLKQIRTMAEASDLTTAAAATSRAQGLVNDIHKTLPRDSKKAFDNALNDLRHWYGVREDTKTKVEIARPLLGELAAELGRRLVSEKVLSKAQQIWLLRDSEVSSAIQGQRIPYAVLERRESLLAWKAKQSWLPAGFVADECSPLDEVWKGLPGSPGKVSGAARLVNGPLQFGEVKKGEIVVARSTNPVWTQLFGQIGAIVVENGSRLSHAAVVAREYGIPCVVGLPGITTALKTGESITVDGDTGQVSRLRNRRDEFSDAA